MGLINYCIEEPGSFFTDFQNACIQISKKFYKGLLKYQHRKREMMNKNEQPNFLVRSYFKSIFYHEVLGLYEEALK